MTSENIMKERWDQLGLPPMELAESSENSRDNNGLYKCLFPSLQKVIVMLLLTTFGVGTYVLLFKLSEKYDNTRNIEIIMVTGNNEIPNVTVHNTEIYLQLKNETSDQKLRSEPKTKRKKRHTNAPVEAGLDMDPIINLNDEQLQKAREIILNHDVVCKNENQQGICKDFVSKLRAIEHNEDDTKSNENPSRIKLKVHDDATMPCHQRINDEIKSVTPTDLTKRETLPLDNILESIPNMHLGPRGASALANPNVLVPHSHSVPPQKLTDSFLLSRLLKRHHPRTQGVYPTSEYLAPPYNEHPLTGTVQYPVHSRLSAPTVHDPYYHEDHAELQRFKFHPQDVDIVMTFLTPKSESTVKGRTSNSSQETTCQAGWTPCLDGTCIKEDQWCDGNVDCVDVSDEARCSCIYRVDKSRLCDGYFDCPFGEDEMGCYGCGENMFSCGNLDMNFKGTCFTKEQRCNNVVDCHNHKDEIDCNVLAPSLLKPFFAVSSTEGFLHRNFKGDWFPVCKNPYMWAHDACRRETGLIIRPPFIQIVPIDPLKKIEYLSTGPGGLIQTSDSCMNSSAIYVTCPDLLCGTRVQSTSQLLRENPAVENHLFGRNKRFTPRNHRCPTSKLYGNHLKGRENVDEINSKTNYEIKFDTPQRDFFDRSRNKRTETRVVGGLPSQPAAWPWMIALYRNGMFHCGGVVITHSWVVSAAHCVHKFWVHYYEVQVGMLRRFSFSPQEQSHRVTHVIVNQHYSQTDMKNDLSLLKVEPAIQFSRWVRPICLPSPDTAGPDWLWGPSPGTICTAVGWGSTTEHGPDPDHMREVEVPVWSNCKHAEDRAGNEICAGYAKGGKDACQGDSGGPLLCRNPLNSQQWYMAGIVSHGDGCARKDEPGVYTRVSLFVKWIKYHISSKTLPTIQPIQECPGFKCQTGISRCLPNKRKCDKIVDCLDGEDETECEFSRIVPTLEDSLFTDPKNNLEELLESKKVQTESMLTSSSEKNQEDTTPITMNLDDATSTLRPENDVIITSPDDANTNNTNGNHFDINSSNEEDGEHHSKSKDDDNTDKSDDLNSNTFIAENIGYDLQSKESSDNYNTNVDKKDNLSSSTTIEKNIDEDPQSKESIDVVNTNDDKKDNLNSNIFIVENIGNEPQSKTAADNHNTNDDKGKNLNSSTIIEKNIDEDPQSKEATDDVNTNDQNTDDSKINTVIEENFGSEPQSKGSFANYESNDRNSDNLDSTTELDFNNSHLQSRESTNNVNKNDRINENLNFNIQVEENVDNHPQSKESNNDKKPDFEHASTLEISNDESLENIALSRETATFDPIIITTTEKNSLTRGDVEMMTIDLSVESLESGSSIKEQVTESPMHKQHTELQKIKDDTFGSNIITEHSMETSTSAFNTLDLGASNETVESTSHSNLENLHENNIDNKVENKSGLVIELLPDTHSTVPDHDATESILINNNNNETHHHIDLSTKKLLDPDSDLSLDKPDILNQIEDIGLSAFEPAKLRRKHHVPNEFKCRRIEQIIPYHQRCDRKANCEDGTDELDCTCTDFLSTFDENLICDGIIDCADGQDESDCFSCPENHFLCKRSQICLPERHVCDGKSECPHGEDELNCFALTNGKELLMDVEHRPIVNLEGYITRKHLNDWHVVCDDKLTPEQQDQAATHICRYLGFSSANRYNVKYINLKEDEIAEHSLDNKRNRRDTMERVPIHFAYTQESGENETARHTIIKEPQVIKEQCVPNITKTCKSLYVFCDNSLFTNFDGSENVLFMREAESVSNHAWPWIAKVFVEGDYRCTGVLVNLSWVLVSDSCLWDSTLSHHYITVVLGSHRTLGGMNGAHEQVYQVDSKKDVYRSKASLLHLKEPAHYSNVVKPMVISSSTYYSSYSLEQNSSCVAVGQDYKNNTISVFLEETTENCHLSNRCFKRQSSQNICPPEVTSHQHWAGIISCHTDQGWYPAATFVDGRGECGLGDRINATDIEYLKNELKHHHGKKTLPSLIDKQHGDACVGVRCSRGRCVASLHVCDGVRDCEDGNDESEDACKKKQEVCDKDPYHKGCECSVGQMKCRNGKCISKELFRDGNNDCGDGTDEPNQTICKDYLATVMPSRLCDGILHCHDRSDEDPMYCKCFAKKNFMCGSKWGIEHCVAPDMVCDGVRDCPNGEDEQTCMALNAPHGTPYGTGQVIVRSHGVWHSKCYPTANHTKSELEAICSELGYKSGHAKQIKEMENFILHPYNNLEIDPFNEIILNNNTVIKMRNTDEAIAKPVLDQEVKNCYPVFIECR